ncbi:uncharacterized protein L969DRAFT_92755 [Mixia osmundae IAM 14324]|uniref:ATP synthase subunit epsilon, mitochondrial n=1 Tax=Mixia osmundae (strain CBS 9802 / IAM 14324 / JCM 22182 / KY 12970) TaxID=764103 RepID=G7DYG5_MIXOS|nr:uncharacterized protein L969DRAFT_92755 [Mixia osmundae IAM 14324]KEI41527.1 hypothetical protein L969DRAFT_92755 [Mixia osmundae IAM 14324]GAA95625.1 hypothetical protein E5Q_02282 [Mixia osmundae IAM 14324]
MARGTLSFNKWISITARATRQALKEDARVKAERRGDISLRYQEWKAGKAGEQASRDSSELRGLCSRLLACRLGSSRRWKDIRRSLGSHKPMQGLSCIVCGHCASVRFESVARYEMKTRGYNICRKYYQGTV